MLAVTQPLRIGDWVSFEDAYGIVEDVRLNYTVLRTASEQRIVIPNERLAGGILRNDTLVVGAVVARRLGLDRPRRRRGPRGACRSRRRPAAARRSPRRRPRASASR